MSNFFERVVKHSARIKTIRRHGVEYWKYKKNIKLKLKKRARHTPINCKCNRNLGNYARSIECICLWILCETIYNVVAMSSRNICYWPPLCVIISMWWTKKMLKKLNIFPMSLCQCLLSYDVFVCRYVMYVHSRLDSIFSCEEIKLLLLNSEPIDHE